MNPHPFDPLQIGRYTVIRVYYEYIGQPGEEKLFVALRHESSGPKDFCWCVKATSKVHRFSDQMLKGCIFYRANEVDFFNQDTVIDPSNFLPMLHETLRKEAALGRYRIEGKMPEDFHSRFVEAVRASPVLEPKKKLKLLQAVGETMG